MGLRDQQKSSGAHQGLWPLRMVKYLILNPRSRWQAMPREMVKLIASPSKLRKLDCGREHANLHNCKRHEVLKQLDPNSVYDHWAHRRTYQESLERKPQVAIGKS